MNLELELKLEPDDSADLEALIPALELGPPGCLPLRATYFDTPDLALAHSGHVLRIRQEGPRRVQTVKGPARAGDDPLARQEWERTVEGHTPDLEDDNPVRALLGDRVADLIPRFEVRNDRRLWRIERDGASIELALDKGEVRAGEAAAPFAEIELELKDGSPDALFPLARQIGRMIPVRLGILAKAERAQRLIAPPRRDDRAGTLRLTPDMTAQDAFRTIAHACLRHYRLNETRFLASAAPTGGEKPGVGEKDDGKDDGAAALHQARVALRRLRTALRLFRPLADGRTARRLNEELRWLCGQLAPARDIDVLIRRLRGAGDAPAADRLHEARAGAYAQARRAMTTQRTREIMLACAEWLSVGRWSGRARTAKGRLKPARTYAARTIGRLYDRLVARAPALHGPDDRLRHAMRKDAKRLRYAVEFFALLFDSGKERKARIRLLAALERMQDELGALNDMAVAPRLLGALGLSADGMTATETRSAHLAAADDALTLFLEAERFWQG